MLWTHLALLFLCADVPWQREAVDDGLLLEVQSVPSASLENIRVTGNSTASAEVFAQAWWGDAADLSDNPSLAKREILLDRQDERLFYDVVSVPLASNRDYVMHAVRRRDDKSGVITLSFKSVEDRRKPVTPDLVRMRVEASVTFTPDPRGGCQFVYTISTDIGGWLPAFVLKGPLRSATLGSAKELRRRAQTAK